MVVTHRLKNLCSRGNERMGQKVLSGGQALAHAAVSDELLVKGELFSGGRELLPDNLKVCIAEILSKDTLACVQGTPSFPSSGLSMSERPANYPFAALPFTGLQYTFYFKHNLRHMTLGMPWNLSGFVALARPSSWLVSPKFFSSRFLRRLLKRGQLWNTGQGIAIHLSQPVKFKATLESDYSGFSPHHPNSMQVVILGNRPNTARQRLSPSTYHLHCHLTSDWILLLGPSDDSKK